MRANTKLINFRVTDQEHARAHALAKSEKGTVTAMLRRMLDKGYHKALKDKSIKAVD